MCELLITWSLSLTWGKPNNCIPAFVCWHLEWKLHIFSLRPDVSWPNKCTYFPLPEKLTYTVMKWAGHWILSEKGEHMDITPPTSLDYFWCFIDTNFSSSSSTSDVSGSCYACYILKHLCMQICFFCLNIRYCFSTFARIQTSFQGPHAVILSQSQFQQTLLCNLLWKCVYIDVQ